MVTLAAVQSIHVYPSTPTDRTILHKFAFTLIEYRYAGRGRSGGRFCRCSRRSRRRRRRCRSVTRLAFAYFFISRTKAMNNKKTTTQFYYYNGFRLIDGKYNTGKHGNR